MQISGDVIQNVHALRARRGGNQCAVALGTRGPGRLIIRAPSVSAPCSSGCSKVSKVEQAALASVEYSL
jgi:hypothetical protein